MTLFSAATTVLYLALVLALCHQYPCSSASRPPPLLSTIKPQQQYGDGIDPIAINQPIFSIPQGGPTQLPFVPTTPPYSSLPSFPSFQHPTLPRLPLPPPRSSSTTTGGSDPSSGTGESEPAMSGGNNNNNIAGGGGNRVRGVGFPYQSMPSYVPKFPPFPFIPTMPNMPSVPLPRLQPDSGGSSSSTATPSSSSSAASSSSSPACNDKTQSQTGAGSSNSQPGH